MKLNLLVLLLVGVQLAHTQTLKSLAEKHNRYIGVAVAASQLGTAQFTSVLDAQIDMITPENEMKWGSIEATKGQLNLGQGDQIVAHAQQHGIKVRGHTLVWHSQLPSWVENGQWTAATLKQTMTDHITAVMTHYKGKIYAWDVVNEIFNEDGTFRQSVFYRILGKDFVAEAFKAAKAADPAAKLYINDYNVESTNAKSTAMLNLVKELKAAGVPIDGAGFQSHFSVGQVPGDFKSNLDRFSAAGVDVAITELDIAITMPANANSLASQAKDYGTVFSDCVAVSRCVGVTIWGLTDAHSWIPDFSNHQKGAALPWDESYKEKPAVAAIKQALS